MCFSSKISTGNHVCKQVVNVREVSVPICVNMNMHCFCQNPLCNLFLSLISLSFRIYLTACSCLNMVLLQNYFVNCCLVNQKIKLQFYFLQKNLQFSSQHFLQSSNRIYTGDKLSKTLEMPPWDPFKCLPCPGYRR